MMTLNELARELELNIEVSKKYTMGEVFLPQEVAEEILEYLNILQRQVESRD